MKLLLDTALLLWAAGLPDRFSAAALKLIDNPANELLFSAASIWEVAIKRGLGRSDSQSDRRLLRRGLLDNGYGELPILSDHAGRHRQSPAHPQRPLRPSAGGSGPSGRDHSAYGGPDGGAVSRPGAQAVSKS
jgi:PIN domain nuclease of toxin-antitoxin system